MRLRVLVEGRTDVPTVRTILQRSFGLQQGIDFEVQPHQGKGKLPPPNTKADPRQRTLLHQLPAKLRGMAHEHDVCVVVLVDADRDDCRALLAELQDMLQGLPRRPRRVLFRIAIEETESWFIADVPAVRAAYPKADVKALKRIRPDAICGAWEKLAVAVGSVANGRPEALKMEWADRIPQHLDLDAPKSPSLARFIAGIERELRAQQHPGQR